MTVKEFGELQVGDFVVGSDGKPVEVLRVYDEHIPETMWELEMEDGTLISASGNHLWYCETSLDWELHRSRKIVGKKLWRTLTKETRALLEETATKDESVETRLIDMVTLLRVSDNREFFQAVERIADAIGHVAEETSTYEDFLWDESEEELIRTYDARLFAQQLLALSGERRYSHHKLIVGSVMTTDAMMSMGDSVEIPVTRALGR